jgi:hypothetical protein
VSRGRHRSYKIASLLVSLLLSYTTHFLSARNLYRTELCGAPALLPSKYCRGRHDVGCASFPVLESREYPRHETSLSVFRTHTCIPLYNVRYRVHFKTTLVVGTQNLPASSSMSRRFLRKRKYRVCWDSHMSVCGGVQKRAHRDSSVICLSWDSTRHCGNYGAGIITPPLCPLLFFLITHGSSSFSKTK